MPKIILTDSYSTSNSARTVDTNSVVVPLLVYKGKSSDSATITYKLDGEYDYYEFDNANTFANTFPIKPGLGADSTNEPTYTNRVAYVKLREDSDSYCVDQSWFMIYKLLLKGAVVIVKPIPVSSFTEEQDGDSTIFYPVPISYEAARSDVVSASYDVFSDYNIPVKFLTTGVYYTGAVSKTSEDKYFCNWNDTISSVASVRGEAKALLAIDDVEFANDGSKLLIDIVSYGGAPSTPTYNSVFAPSGNYTLEYNLPKSGAWTYGSDASNTVEWCNKDGSYTSHKNWPACYGYLSAYYTMIQTYAGWNAVAGITRGVIPDLVSTSYDIPESVMHVIQGDDDTDIKFYINPIMYRPGYSYRIWGNRTSFVGTGAGDYRMYLSTTLMASDIKKQIFVSAIENTFEPNDSVTWVNFKSSVNVLLDRMRSGRGLKNYYWKKIVDGNLGSITAVLNCSPIEAVENFDININFTQDGTEIVTSEDNIAEEV